jgi:hypothetical protein
MIVRFESSYASTLKHSLSDTDCQTLVNRFMPMMDTIQALVDQASETGVWPRSIYGRICALLIS